MNSADLLVKADRALASARLPYAAGDRDGACNRAYYAMFDATRAALVARDARAPRVKTHGGLIALFSTRPVKTGLVPVVHGRALNKVEELRHVADYRGESVDAEIVQAAVEQADAFVRAMHTLVAQAKS